MSNINGPPGPLMAGPLVQKVGLCVMYVVWLLQVSGYWYVRELVNHSIAYFLNR